MNSGFLRFNPDGSGVITPRARARYNALIGIYSMKFTPPLNVDYGIAMLIDPLEFTITADALVKFMTMNRWKKEGQ